jgi:hypothetical protein
MMPTGIVSWVRVCRLYSPHQPLGATIGQTPIPISACRPSAARRGAGEWRRHSFRGWPTDFREKKQQYAQAGFMAGAFLPKGTMDHCAGGAGTKTVHAVTVSKGVSGRSHTVNTRRGLFSQNARKEPLNSRANGRYGVFSRGINGRKVEKSLRHNIKNNNYLQIHTYLISFFPVLFLSPLKRP